MLARYANKVHILNKYSRLQANPLLRERAVGEHNIQAHMNSLVQEIGGNDNVRWVKLQNVSNDEVRTLDVDGVFVYVGFKPNSELLRGIVKLDDGGYVITNWQMCTSAPGIFAAGDVTAFTFRQLTNAAGDGATAALSAYEYLEEQRAAASPNHTQARRVKHKPPARRKKAA
jgi:thioredoxin reductase (NADPH)